MGRDTDQAQSGLLESAAGSALRTIDEVRQLLAEATGDNLAERAAAAMAKLESSHAALAQMGDEKPHSLGQMLLGAERSLRDELDELERRVRANPLRTLLAAAGVGLLLGLVVSRQR